MSDPIRIRQVLPNGVGAVGTLTVPAAAPTTTKFLRDDATWQTPPGTATVQAQYVTLATDTGLTNERVLTAGTGITITDGGANSTVTIASTASGGLSKSEAFTSNGNFTVPAGVTVVWFSGIAGGGGGGGSTTSVVGGGSGGGSGEMVDRFPILVTPAAVMAVTVGIAGAGGAVAGGTGSTGGTTSFGGFSLAGGLGGSANGGKGGGVNGASQDGTNFWGLPGLAESPNHFGGSSGGQGGSTSANGKVGGGSGGFTLGAAGGAANGTHGGGGGGAASIYGQGGAGGAGDVAGVSAAATSYGAGGGGAGGFTAHVGGDGAPGYVLIQWIG
jgi:hypothetical protein